MMRLQRLSVLIFSKDDADNTTALIKDVSEITDQIVLIDSGSTSNLRRRSGNSKLDTPIRCIDGATKETREAI